MSILFLSGISAEENKGIFKKNCSQAKYMSNHKKQCWLLYFKKQEIRVREFYDKQMIHDSLLTKSDATNHRQKIKDIQIATKKLLLSREWTHFYFRDQYYTKIMSELLSISQQKTIQTIMEIPTYPYYKEQLNVAPNKLKGGLSLVWNYLGDRLYEKKCNKIAVIEAKTSNKKKAKMVSFYNGVDPDNLPVNLYQKNEEQPTHRVVAVGNFYPYHGLDRLIEGLEYYYRTKDEIAPEVFFDIVGGGPAIEELKQLVASYRLQGYVIFHGYKDRQELEQLYGEASMAIGTLKLHLRGANIETAIKVSEALYQGIPVITSGETPFFSAVKQNIYQVKDDDSPISINEMLKFLGKKRIPVGDQVLLDLFSWEKIIEKIVNFGSEN
ncbi:glycosyltransferase family 4 protein [Enterococcus hirae]|nr:glycosyltransferase family 4 protein [Enterococcus hirae]